MPDIDLTGTLLQRDVQDEQTALGGQAARLQKAQSTGSMLGGVLGGLIGVALAPVTAGASLLFAGIGSAVGSFAGSQVGKGMSGVSDADLAKGKFMKKSRGGIIGDLAQANINDAIMSGIGGAFNAGFLKEGATAFKAGFKEGGLIGGLGGIGKAWVPGLGKESVKEVTEKTVTDKAASVVSKTAKNMDLTNIVADVGKLNQGGIGDVVGGLLKGGKSKIGDVVGGIGDLYTGVDKGLGGILPGGQNIKEGYLSGLLGSQTGQSQYTGPIIDNNMVSLGKNLVKNQVTKTASALLDNAEPHNPDWVKEFQMQYMGMKPGDSGFGFFGPKTTAKYRSVQ